MQPTFLDHLTVTAFSLKAGAAWVAEALGVCPEPGGEHPHMATHNLLLRLGHAVFLEVIAPNPAAPKPARARWFGLDDVSSASLPSLSAWVVRTADVDASVAAASEPLGRVETLSRGAFRWRMTVTPDGSVPLGGAAPALIEWETEAHPAARLKDQGLSLARLEIFHPSPGQVTRLLASLALDAPVEVKPIEAGSSARLVAHIETPQGLRRLLTAA